MKRVVSIICLVALMLSMFAGFAMAAQKHPDDCTCDKCNECVKHLGIECHCPLCTYNPNWGLGGANEP